MATETETPEDIEDDELDGAEEPQRLDLTVEVEDTGPCLKHVRVVVPRADIDRSRDELLDEFIDEAQVPGFRPGRAPKELVLKRFKDEVDDKVKQNVLFASLEQLSDEQDFDPINQPDLDIDALEIPEEGDFEYEFDIEVRPEFDLPSFAGLEIENYEADVSDEQVAEAVDRYVSQYGQLAPIEEAAQIGDQLTLEAKFTKDGEVVHEIDEFTARLRPVLRFQDAEIEGFDTLFEGAEIDDKKECDVLVSPGAEKAELRGETLHAEFTLVDLKRADRPELDEALLERMGVESAEELTGNIRQSLERQAKYQQRQHARDQVLSKITASATWELPEKLVTRQTDNALRRELLEMRQAGFTDADIRARENQLRQNAIEETRSALKQHFVLDRVATENDLEVEEQELETEVLMMALQSGDSPRKVRSQLQKSGMIENLEAQLRERKAIDFILGQAKMKDVPLPTPEKDRVEAVGVSVCGMVDVVESEDEEE
ncbi:MAG: trigger factor [Planctomycetota bacterium]